MNVRSSRESNPRRALGATGTSLALALGLGTRLAEVFGTRWKAAADG
ncbi:hypothetical protein AB0J52_00065 [Spirillospora sp. NPDC049652]